MSPGFVILCLAATILVLLAVVSLIVEQKRDWQARERRISAETERLRSQWAREAVDNIDLRAENTALKIELATRLGHPSVGQGSNVVPIRGAR